MLFLDYRKYNCVCVYIYLHASLFPTFFGITQYGSTGIAMGGGRAYNIPSVISCRDT